MGSTPSISDQELIEGALKGDDHAFTTLVKKYEGRIAATTIGMLGPGEEAEDVGQEVFIRFYRSMNKFRGESELGTYLTRIAINLSLNALKKRKRRKIFSIFQQEAEPVMQIADQHDTPAQRDTQALVHRALQDLEEQFRSVVVLRMIEGYSTKETAEILGVPLGTVLSRLTRAQKKLRTIIESHYQ